ncbi:MAG TPA: hypothetical protein VFR68_12745 [Candidatus Dormibacteraeota bacterium]|nr:hypothetical protein [Candidatus Dormibacteraeota bacterium]
MAEARLTKHGRWRIYGPNGSSIRDRVGEAIPTFPSLADAQRWWGERHANDGPLEEAVKCSWCGAYFGPAAEATLYAGRHYHRVHTPPAIAAGRGDSLDRS